jgi:hypothetical protein
MEQAVDIDQAKICRELAPEVAVFIRVGAVEFTSIFGVEGDVFDAIEVATNYRIWRQGREETIKFNEGLKTFIGACV